MLTKVTKARTVLTDSQILLSVPLSGMSSLLHKSLADTKIHMLCVYRFWGVQLHLWKKLPEAFMSCVQSDNLSPALSLSGTEEQRAEHTDNNELTAHRVIKTLTSNIQCTVCCLFSWLPGWRMTSPTWSNLVAWERVMMTSPSLAKYFIDFRLEVLGVAALKKGGAIWKKTLP